MYNSRSSTPCRNGVDCYYLRQGTCWFYHPDWHQDAVVSSESDNEESQNSYSFHPRHTINNINFVNDLRLLNIERLGLQIDRLEKKCLQIQQKRNKIFEKEEQIKKPQTKLILGGKQVQLVKIYSELPKEKSWFFEKSHHFHHFPSFQLQQCSICIQKFQQGQLLSYLFCKHAFHHQCISKWLKTAQKCPLCRKDFRHHNEFKSIEGYTEQNKPHLFWRDISVSNGSENNQNFEIDFSDGNQSVSFDGDEYVDEDYQNYDDDDFGFNF